MSDHNHDCPRCNGYFCCDASECEPDDMCADCNRTRVAELEAELAKAKQEAKTHEESCKVLCWERDEAWAEVRRLREALGKYGRHLDGCCVHGFVARHCDCGLDAALAGGEEAP